jgi:hypothetical protein
MYSGSKGMRATAARPDSSRGIGGCQAIETMTLYGVLAVFHIGPLVVRREFAVDNAMS